jgi:hypothetical protein
VSTIYNLSRMHMNPRSSSPTSEGDSRRTASALTASFGRSIAWEDLIYGGPATR